MKNFCAVKCFCAKKMNIKCKFSTSLEVHMNPIENDWHSISYCKWDSFIPKCLGNDIIIIQSALYGRMSVGKCLTSYYQIGCYANVQDYLDFVCTGKTNCSLTIPNKYLDFMHSCRRDLSSYLTVTYQCHKVVTEKQCNVKPKENIVLTKNGYISTFSIFKSKSEKSCILYLTAEKGKRWNITIFNLNNVNVNSTKTLQFIITLMKNNSKGPYIHSINNGHCSSVAEIHENSLKYSLSMCPVNQNLAVNGYINQHYKTISFFSQTSNIVIHFVSPFSNIRQKSINNFLFQYQGKISYLPQFSMSRLHS
ncbi:hypothetical protein A3Q56_02003 [Intoshia linei]|uniref:SUEL-type lectin domain-containing protein n=1 Tax=Intoshia linei TaxID=1819745 RepID=A0A177B7I4_9BILA|nr:hypothetical protein A3Q56_02003 [Intoshia linei]